MGKIQTLLDWFTKRLEQYGKGGRGAWGDYEGVLVLGMWQLELTRYSLCFTGMILLVSLIHNFICFLSHYIGTFSLFFFFFIV